MSTYLLNGIVKTESFARQICDLMEKMDPAPIGVGFFELDAKDATWEVESYFKNKPKLADLTLLETIFKTHLKISKIKPINWVTEVQRHLTPISIFLYISKKESILSTKFL